MAIREYRVALLTELMDEKHLRETWQEIVNKRGKLDLSRCHIQTIRNKYAICRWDWLMLNDGDIYDFINLCEKEEIKYQLILIGRQGLSDVRTFISHSRFRLPVHLETHVTVDLVEGKWKNPITGEE